MRRALILLVALLLPVLAWYAYAWLERRRARRRGESPPPWWVNAPWPGIAAAAVGLMLVMLVGLVLLGDGPRFGAYVPAQVVGGKVVPGHLEPAAPSPSAP